MHYQHQFTTATHHELKMPINNTLHGWHKEVVALKRAGCCSFFIFLFFKVLFSTISVNYG